MATEVAEAVGDVVAVVEKSSPAAGKEETDDRLYELRVKAGFELTERPSCLAPLPEEKEPSKESNKQKRKRKRDQAVKDRYCLAVLRGDTCPFGADKCKFSHELKELLSSLPPEIDVEGGCPHFRLYGFCMYGASCRLGSSHVNMATGQNIRRDPVTSPPPPVLNVLDKQVQTQLRKKTYPFKCKRYNERKKKADTDGKPSNHTPADTSPLPAKTRRLIDFSNKVYIAPLTTVGNLPFRRIMKRFGADITCGEMALAANLLGGQSSEWALLKRHPEEDVFGVQVAAGFPDMYTRACEVIEAQTTVDFVDLNLGCPLDLVNNRGCGAALMMREKKLQQIVQSITKVLSCPISIKMRTGWDTAKPFAHELVAKIQSWGIDSITAVMVHGRSRTQRYAKEADWDYIQKVAQSQSSDLKQIPVLGNGDIFSYSDFEEKVARDGISSCAMLARGALIKPWLPTEIKEKRHWDISASERLDILKDFVRFGLEHWGSDQQGVDKCRRFLLEWLSFLYRYVSTVFCRDSHQTLLHTLHI